MREFLSLAEERFEAPLEPRVTYVDSDGDTITVTTDAEFNETLSSGVVR